MACCCGLCMNMFITKANETENVGELVGRSFLYEFESEKNPKIFIHWSRGSAERIWGDFSFGPANFWKVAGEFLSEFLQRILSANFSASIPLHFHISELNCFFTPIFCLCHLWGIPTFVIVSVADDSIRITMQGNIGRTCSWLVTSLRIIRGYFIKK